MKNILIIIPNLKGGGAERVVSLLSRKLADKYNLYLVVFDAKDIKYKYKGVLINLNIEPKAGLLNKFLNLVKRIKKLKVVKQEYKVDVAISFLTGANIVNLLSKKDEKVIVSERTYLSKGKNTFLKKMNSFMIKRLYNRANTIVAISKGVAEDLIRNYNLSDGQVCYIHNPINYNEIVKLSKEGEPNLDKASFTIINVGRLSIAKGQWHLIRAISVVKEYIRDVRVFIIGVGELEGVLKQTILDLNLQENVELLGYKSNPFSYIKQSDLFAFTSLYEGFGNVIIESMACGIPVVSTDCKSGPREIISPNSNPQKKITEIEMGEYGILIPPFSGEILESNVKLTNEEHLLAKAIIKLYKDKKLRNEYSEYGKERARHFELDKIIKQWENVIEM